MNQPDTPLHWMTHSSFQHALLRNCLKVKMEWWAENNKHNLYPVKWMSHMSDRWGGSTHVCVEECCWRCFFSALISGLCCLQQIQVPCLPADLHFVICCISPLWLCFNILLILLCSFCLFVQYSTLFCSNVFHLIYDVVFCCCSTCASRFDVLCIHR